MNILKNMGFGLLVVIGAIVAVVACELGVSELLGLGLFDMTGNFFTTAVFPVHLVVLGITIFCLSFVIRRKPMVFGLLFLVVLFVVYSLLLNSFFNPMSDILRYWISLALVCGIWVTLLRGRLFPG